MADDFLTSGEGCPGGCVVEAAEEGGDIAELAIGPFDVVGMVGNGAGQKGQNLPSLVVKAADTGRGVEADSFQVAKQVVDERGVGATRAMDVAADADDTRC